MKSEIQADEKPAKNVGLSDYIGPITKIDEMGYQDPLDFYLELFDKQSRMPNTRTKNNNYIFNVDWAKGFRHLIHKFKGLSPKGRAYIMAAKTDGVSWRGESYPQFKDIYERTIAYKALTPLAKADYKANVMQIAKDFVGRRNEVTR